MAVHRRAYLWRSTSNYHRRLRYGHDVQKFREYILELVNYLRYRDID